MTTLDQLQPGELGRVVAVSGNDGISTRLREMGLIPGQIIKLIRFAPLGGPVKCLVAGCRLAVRTTEAKRIGIDRVA
jgi:Fe2+ transport system protein FeoA